jgi:SagB-type dehydrogenase family enzyme
MTRPPLTIDVAERILGGPVPFDDPAETFHEASRLSPSTIGAQFAGAARLDADAFLQVSSRRGSRLHRHRPGVELPRPRLPRVRLRDAIVSRRSRLDTGSDTLGLRELSALLGFGYGSTATPLGARRPVPSAGALYPLELYVLAQAVDDLPAGVYHYDPYRHRLERLVTPSESEVAAAWYEPELAARAAAALVVTAVLPRTRFKYGQRGYRFALLEAGHLGQNVMLTASALRRDALPYGGFYDRALDALVCADSVDECAVHVVLVR